MSAARHVPAAKQAWVAAVNSPELVYVSGRTRQAGEINGKSGNLNNALNLIYPPGVEIPLDEVRRQRGTGVSYKDSELGNLMRSTLDV